MPGKDAVIRVSLSFSVCRTDEALHQDGHKQLGRCLGSCFERANLWRRSQTSQRRRTQREEAGERELGVRYRFGSHGYILTWLKKVDIAGVGRKSVWTEGCLCVSMQACV